MRRHLLEQAEHIAESLNPVMVKELSFTPADKGAPAFEFIRRQMTTLGKYVRQRGVYSMTLREGKLVFGPENYAADDPMSSPVGTVYQEPAKEALESFAQGKAVVGGPYVDEYGTFVSAFAPVRDPSDGRVLMVVAIDALAGDWRAALRTLQYGPVLGTALLALAAGAVLLAGRRRRAKNGGNPECPSAGAPQERKGVLRGASRTSAGLLAGMGVLAVAFLGTVLLQTWRWTHDRIGANASHQARLVAEFETVLRDYVGKHIRPEMDKRVHPGEFVPEAMSTSFVARSVFEGVHKVFPDAVLRFPSTNPRNPVNQATPSEESLIRYFEQNPQIDTWSGTMEFYEQGEEYFVYAVPRRNESSCLQCHGRPQDAPASLVERYGAVAGFGRPIGEVTLDLVAVPVNAAYAQAGAQIWRCMLTALVLCVLFLAGIVFLIRADARHRRRAAMAIEREKRFLRLVIDSIPGFVCVKSREGRFLLVNEALAKAYGATVQDIEGKSDQDFNPIAEQVESCRRSDLEVIDARKAIMDREETITCHDGTTHWLTTTKVPLLDEDGACNRLLSVATDITRRKQAEEDLRESFSLLEATFESTADGILVVDGLGKIKGFNTQFRELWRIPTDVLESRDDRATLSAALSRLKNPDSFVSRVQDLYAHPESESLDILEFTDGRIIERYSKPQRLADRIVGRVWSFRDVTARRLAEQKQTALLRQVAGINEELTHFAYVVSHDLKAPLRGIKLVTEWLCEDYADKLGDDAKEQLSLLQSRVDRMHGLIDGILQYSRVGRIQEESQEVDLNALIPDLIDGIAPPGHIHITVESGLPVVECEKTRVSQVFQNLLTNAVKFMDKPVGEIRVGCAQDGEFWQFSVSDNGPGIEEKYFDRIFHLFQTLAPRDEFESTGVGLALVKKIVELYGGRVWLESEVGRGSTFLFTLPKSRAAVAPSHAPEAACQLVS